MALRACAHPFHSTDTQNGTAMNARHSRDGHDCKRSVCGSGMKARSVYDNMWVLATLQTVGR